MINNTHYTVDQQDYLEYKSEDWFVNIESVATNYIVLESGTIDLFKNETPPQLPKFHPIYKEYWSNEIKTCIEGKFVKQFGKYRFYPGNLYFVFNYSILEHTYDTNDGTTIRDYIRPLMGDYMWDYAYDSLTCYGFSGFSEDNEYSSNAKLKHFYDNLDYYNEHLDKKHDYLKSLSKYCFKYETGTKLVTNKKGFKTTEKLVNTKTFTKSEDTLKKYIDPLDYLRNLHNEPKGNCLFQNEASDNMVLGSRGGMKSYWVALGEIEYNFIFGGSRRYGDFINRRAKANLCIGSEQSNKSSELLNKFIASRNAKVDPDKELFKKIFGVYEETSSTGVKKIIPCPLYKRSLGTLNVNNKTPSKLFRAGYKIKDPGSGEYVERGSGDSIAHVSYSGNKSDSFRAAEGGRYLFSNIEEVGSCLDSKRILGANDGATRAGGFKFGVQWNQGTSGNIEAIMDTKEIFLDPRSFNMLAHKNQFGNDGTNGEICRFIPNYISLLEFKDEEGNTDFISAINKVNKKRIELFNSSDPNVLHEYTMNHPCYIREMWHSLKGYYLPKNEANLRERQLLEFEKYKTIGRAVKLIYDPNSLNGVKVEDELEKTPYQTYPISKKIDHRKKGCPVIYQMPIPDVPDDYYVLGLDSYVEENLEDGGSLGACYIVTSDKYIHLGLPANELVAEYVAKPIEGLKYYYETLYKLHCLYGKKPQSLCFEKNRGETCREFYIGKNDIESLMPTPQYIQGTSVKERIHTSFGYICSGSGESTSKKILLQRMNDFLLKQVENHKTGKLETVISKIPSLFLIQQIANYEIKGNFDAVDGYRGAVIGHTEIEARDDYEKSVGNSSNARILNIYRKKLKNKRNKNSNNRFVNKQITRTR